MNRLWPFAVMLSVLAAAGCAGTGLFQREDVSRGQIFGPFRSSASRLDLTPQSAARPTKKDVLLIASVYDADGKPLKRQSVEWTIDGPGEFVTVDDGGWFTARGKKKDGKFVTTTTHTFSEKLARKTGKRDGPSDEPTIQPGQTWVIVSSAVEGRTVVTAVCPDVTDREKSRSVATIVWSDAEVGFPGTAVVPAGGEFALSTNLARVVDAAGAPGYRVRYRILGGAPASLMPGGLGGNVALSGGNSQEVVTVPSLEGMAGAKIVQAAPAAGQTRVAVEILKPDPTGVGPGTVVSRSETTVEWATPQLSLDVRGPSAVGEGREATYQIIVGNAGKADSAPVTVRTILPNSAAFVSADPPPTVQQGREIAWALPAVIGGQRRDVKLTLRPARRGTFDLLTSAETPDGQRAEYKFTAMVDVASLKASLDVPSFAPVGEAIPVRVTVSNPGAVAVDNVTAWVSAAEGLTAIRRESNQPIELSLGTIEPGKSQTAEVLMQAARAGAYPVKINITADGGLKEKAEATVDARTMSLSVNVSGPDRVGVGESVTYLVKLKNGGEMALTNLAVKAEMPRGLNAVGAEGGQVSGAGGFATWKLAALNPGESRTLKLSALGDRPGPAGNLIVTSTVTTAGTKPREQRSETPVTVAGLPAIELDLVPPNGPVAVGQKVPYRVIVRNRGNGPARDVVIAVDVPGEFTPVRGRTADGNIASVEEARIVFPVIPNLATGSTVTVTAELEAVRPGSARVRATVTGPDLPTAVREEQATRVTGGGR